MQRYVALLHRDNHGGYAVSFPDFPGCIGAGDTWEEVADNAAAALRFHVEGMLADGEAIPTPSEPEVLRSDPQFADDFKGAMMMAVPLLPPQGKPERINVTVDSNLLRAVDAAAKALKITRSALLAQGAMRVLGTDPAKRYVVKAWRKRATSGRTVMPRKAGTRGRRTRA